MRVLHRSFAPLVVMLLAFARAGGASAQELDGSWNLTVNGQAVSANADGSFRIQNIAAPDLFGPGGPGTIADFLSDDFLRLVGTRTLDGTTEYVFSDPFQLRQGETFTIGALTFSDIPPPQPESLRASCPPGAIRVGEGKQVTATAVLGDGSLLDVTAREAWTVYRTSNPAVASVSKDGFVAGVAPGRAFITASNEGAVAVKEVQVVTVEEPLTTVEGFVRNASGDPITDATVAVIDQAASALSGNEGFYSFSNVVVANLSTLAVAAYHRAGNVLLLGGASQLPPVVNGITDAGIIVLHPYDEVTVDTDGDAVSDYLEIAARLDPYADNGDRLHDSDGDGAPDWVELILGTAPRVAEDQSTDSDANGVTDVAEVLEGFDPYVNTLPNVQLVSPMSDTEFVHGEQVVVAVDASDDGILDVAGFKVSGEVIGEDRLLPYVRDIVVPDDVSELELEVFVFDHGGKAATTGPMFFPVVDDPMTTLTGVVTPPEGESLPDGLAVSAIGETAPPAPVAPDGTFSVPNVPTRSPSVVALAATNIGDALPYWGVASPIAPVRGGVTDVGTISLTRSPYAATGLQIPLTDTGTSLAVEDINGDHLPDIVTVNPQAATVSIRYANTEEGFGPPEMLSIGLYPSITAPVQAFVTNLNHDRLADLVVVAEVGPFAIRTTYVFVGQGQGVFQETQNVDVPLVPIVSDLNGDTSRDLLYGPVSSASSLNPRFGAGDAMFSSNAEFSIPGPPDLQFPILTLLDIISVERPDSSRNQLVALQSAREAFTTVYDLVLLQWQSDNTLRELDRKRIPLGIFNVPSGLRAADVDGDAQPDVLIEWLNGVGGFVPFWVVLRADDGRFAGELSPEGLDFYAPLSTGDLNGDSRDDFVAYPSSFVLPTRPLAAYLSQGDGSFLPEPICCETPLAIAANISDVNGDSLNDVVVGVAPPNSLTSVDSIAVYLNLGDGGFLPQ